MIRASAPGKIILWGEYAVLAGAPGMVMAVDRRATCEIVPGGDLWRFASRGFAAPNTVLTGAQLLTGEPGPAARVAYHALRHLRMTGTGKAELPEGAHVTTDTEGFYIHGEKLGIGSSAAICTAVYAALCELLGVPRDFDQLVRIHNGLQGKRGSGIDLAAAYYGGSLRYQTETAAASSNTSLEPAVSYSVSAHELPSRLNLRFIWTGRAEGTAAHIERFRTWFQHRQIAPLAALINTSQAMFEHTDMQTLARYVADLKGLDAAADLGIYGPAHRRLDRLANELEVVYKPCGAGGGDVGVAISEENGTLDAFTRSAAQLGFLSLPLEKAEHGVEVTR